MRAERAGSGMRGSATREDEDDGGYRSMKGKQREPKKVVSEMRG